MPSFSKQRRMFVKWAAASPVLCAVAYQQASQQLLGAVSSASNVYGKIGVRPFINARGTWTYLSGSLILPEVRASMEAASRQFVDMFELQRAVGQRLASLSGAESGMVTSGLCGSHGQRHGRMYSGFRPRPDLAITGHHRPEKRGHHAGRP